jgi:hypothetical protein
MAYGSLIDDPGEETCDALLDALHDVVVPRTFKSGGKIELASVGPVH